MAYRDHGPSRGHRRRCQTRRPCPEFVVGGCWRGERWSRGHRLMEGSYFQTGATSFGHRVAEQFGIRIVPPRPGLCPGLAAEGMWEALGAWSWVDCGTAGGSDAPEASARPCCSPTGASAVPGPSDFQSLAPGRPVRAGPIPGKSVLDLVCGPGRVADRRLAGNARRVARLVPAALRRATRTKPASAQWPRKN